MVRAVEAQIYPHLNRPIDRAFANKTKCNAGMVVHRQGRALIRPAEQYRQIADNYDRLAVDISDQALRSLYLDFARQWRDVAARAEGVDQIAALDPMCEDSDYRKSP